MTKYLKEQLQLDFGEDHIIENPRHSTKIKFVEIEGRNFLHAPQVIGQLDDETELANREKLIQWVVHRCLNRYFEMHLQSKVREIPKLTSNWSDMPGGEGGGFYSSTEVAFLKNSFAYEWIQAFHVNLSQLPSVHQEIIVKKYLSRDGDGRYPVDQVVYNAMNLSRGNFYRLKKEALYWLALLLKDEAIMR